jgi:hypothetical protein
MADIFETFDKNLYRLYTAVYQTDALSDVTAVPATTIPDINSIIDPGQGASGPSVGNVEMVNGALQSGDFQAGVQGWQIKANGDVEFNAGTFRGTFIIGGALITVSDIANLQPALDALVLIGGGTIALVPATYNVTTSFTIPSNITIDGNGATIDFGGGAYQFSAVGTNAYSTGTLSVNLNSTSVTGSGTTWTAGMVGQSILIGDFWYTISARSSNTAITLSSPFIGTNVSGVTYVIATTVSGINLKNLTLQNSSTTLINFRYVDGFTMDNMFLTSAPLALNGQDSANVNGFNNSSIDTCTAGIVYNNVPNSQIVNTGISNITGGTAVDLTKVSNATFSVFFLQNITGVGLKLTNCYNMDVSSFAIQGCTSNGVELISGNSDMDVSGGYITACGGDGLKLTASSNRIEMLENNIINNTGYGINIANANDNNDVIVGNSFSNNTAGNLNDSGTNTKVRGNQNVADYNQIQTYTPAGGATATIDLSLSNVHHITMPAGNITIALTNGRVGQCFIIRILQDGGGSRTVTWFTTIKWAGGSAPTLTTTASKADTVGFEITGSSTYDGFVVGTNL